MNKDLILKNIAHKLFMHGSFTRNMGLLNGKMGLIIFFYHYAKHSSIEFYNDFANELLDEIYNDISTNLSIIDFTNGIGGIAWGILYLIKNQFVEADEDDVLSEIDKFIIDKRKTLFKSISNDIELHGIISYLINRNNNDNLYDIQLLLLKFFKNNSQLSYYLECLRIKEQQKLVYEDMKVLLENILRNTLYNSQNIFSSTRELGLINNGLTGIGLKLITNV